MFNSTKVTRELCKSLRSSKFLERSHQRPRVPIEFKTWLDALVASRTKLIWASLCKLAWKSGCDAVGMVLEKSGSNELLALHDALIAGSKCIGPLADQDADQIAEVMGRMAVALLLGIELEKRRIRTAASGSSRPLATARSESISRLDGATMAHALSVFSEIKLNYGWHSKDRARRCRCQLCERQSRKRPEPPPAFSWTPRDRSSRSCASSCRNLVSTRKANPQDCSRGGPSRAPCSLLSMRGS
jgi:hypothetical protein